MPEIDFTTLADYRFQDNGQSVLGGRLFGLYQRLDAMFVGWAGEEGAKETLYPIFIPARELARLDYFRSFPHLATFACTLEQTPENLAAFTQGEGVKRDGSVALTEVAPVTDALTPAACYHVYIHQQGTSLDAPLVTTTKNTCFRREAAYSPLQRQSSFGMREIVCVGSAEEVKAFLLRTQDKVASFFHAIGLPIDFMPATDPFFNAAANPKFLAQKIEPVKTEMVYGGKLAIGSVNFHRNFFGETFDISRGGKPAFSGCVAFGLERWIYAFLTQFGDRESGWPRLGS
jgi:seryl-tRNA synthetase